MIMWFICVFEWKQMLVEKVKYIKLPVLAEIGQASTSCIKAADIGQIYELFRFHCIKADKGC